MFGVSKKAQAKWPHLSLQDAKLCWTVAHANKYVSDRDKTLKCYLRAIAGKRYEALAEMCNIPMSWRYVWPKVVFAAYEARDIRALEILTDSYAVRSSGAEDKQEIFESIATASGRWADGFSACLPLFGQIHFAKLLPEVKRFASPALIKHLYEGYPDKTVAIAVGLLERDMSEIMLDYIPASDNLPDVLACICEKVLASLSINTKGKIVDHMITLGMNVNYNKGVLLSLALEMNNLSLAQKIIDGGFNIEQLGEVVLDKVNRSGCHADAIAFIEKMVEGDDVQPSLPSACGVIQTLEHDGFALVASDTVARRIDLPDGGHLSVVFNFTLRQQIVVAHQQDQPASAPTVVPFDTLPAADALDAAATAFKALGGKAAIADRAAYAARPLIAHKPEARS